jgi:hypothetical protein
VTDSLHERGVSARRLDRPSDHTGRLGRFGRLTVAVFKTIALGLAVLGSVLAWLVVVPLVDAVVASAGWARRSLQPRRLR